MKFFRSKLFRGALLATAALVFGGAGTVVGLYLAVSRTLPRVETLDDYRPPIISQVFSDDGTVIAEYYRERRIVVPVSAMPYQLVLAFVAAEDDNFFEHPGIDLASIFRAALKNLRAGRIAQGGSTITQQVAKSLLLTPERSFSRKFKEAILAWRMEQRLTKEEILYLYLNQIYLGHGAYGVQAAAENYFDKDVEELSLAECAMLAGLPQAPSRYSPYRHFDRAKKRQRYVLDRLATEGYITAEEAEEAFAEEVTVHPRVNRYIADAAFFTEEVRRYLEQTYGSEALYTGGLQVHTTMNLDMQLAAQQAVRENLRDHDKRQGFRGPLRVLSGEEVATFLAEQSEVLPEQLEPSSDLLEAVVTGAEGASLLVSLGPYAGIIPLKSARWAGPPQLGATGSEPSGNLEGGASRLPIGSVIHVRVEKVPDQGPLELRLEQQPLAEGALVALAPGSGEVKAMVGGYDFQRSQFNRVTQAQRLPGSAIKPLVYAAALDKGYTPASIILDMPLIYTEKDETGESVQWKPKNYGKKWYGPTTFRDALTRSRNVVTIKILEDIGVGYAANYVRKLGITTPLARDLTLGLGSSAVTPMELATAYAVFANGGIRVKPAYITKVTDRDGRVLASVDPADFPQGPAEDQQLIRQSPVRVLSPETAYLITNIMESVVQGGTGWRAKALGRPAAGKTGTTNDLKDAWFGGFIPQLLAISWVGYDQERPLGDKETGSRAAAPAWVGFMQEAIRQIPARHFPVPDTLEFRPIDKKTGLLLPEDHPEAYVEAFVPGTQPTELATAAEKPTARDFFKMEL